MYIANVAEQAAITPQTAPKTAQEDTIKKTTTLATDNADKFVKSEQTFTPAYTKKTGRKNEAVVGNTEYKGSVAQSKADHLASVVETLISKQSSKAQKESFIDSINEKIKEGNDETGKTGETTEEIQTETETEAEDYWGAEATAQRIFDYAKKLAGDDDSLFSTLKDAFLEGFSQAEGVHGGKGKLPSVCYDTFDKVSEKFDQWEKDIAKKNETKAEDTTTDSSNVKTGSTTA